MIVRVGIASADEQCKVIDIAYDSGYDSVDGYQREFRNAFGCNPYEYAKSPMPLPLFTPYGVTWHKNAIRLMETFGDGGEVPPAWLQKYFRSHFFCGTALCGAGKREEGYAYIEKALELCGKSAALPQDEPLVVGNEAIFGGVKIIPATGVMILPDGSKDICSEWSCYGSAGWMYAGMTARHGWEWLNPVRGMIVSWHWLSVHAE